MAAVPTEGEENSEPLKYKTWVLKVSIHCEGCKRKVKRILHSVEGVYTIDVDTKQHKVVVTGNVEANALLKKLEKSGKHAELWPDFQKKSNKNKNSEEQGQNEEDPNQNQNQNPAVEQEKVAVNVEEGSPRNNEPSSNPVQVVKEVRFEGNIPAAGENQKPPGNDGSAGAAGSGGAKKKKKKKKKGHGGNNTTTNNNNSEEAGEQQQGDNGGPPSGESHPPPQGPGPNQYSNPSPVNMSPPRHMPHNRVYEYPPAYCAPPPVYAVSYNTAYPRSSYTASYYSAPPPYSHAYVHHGGDVEPPLPSDLSSASLHPSDTFELFSDENPNACSVM